MKISQRRVKLVSSDTLGIADVYTYEDTPSSPRMVTSGPYYHGCGELVVDTVDLVHRTKHYLFAGVPVVVHPGAVLFLEGLPEGSQP